MSNLINTSFINYTINILLLYYYNLHIYLIFLDNFILFINLPAYKLYIFIVSYTQIIILSLYFIDNLFYLIYFL